MIIMIDFIREENLCILRTFSVCIEKEYLFYIHTYKEYYWGGKVNVETDCNDYFQSPSANSLVILRGCVGNIFSHL